MNDSYKFKTYVRYYHDIFQLYLLKEKRNHRKKENGASLKKNPRKSRRKANQKRFYKIVYYTYMYEY